MKLEPKLIISRSKYLILLIIFSLLFSQNYWNVYIQFEFMTFEDFYFCIHLFFYKFELEFSCKFGTLT